mgnify:CR=1 FL=1
MKSEYDNSAKSSSQINDNEKWKAAPSVLLVCLRAEAKDANKPGKINCGKWLLGGCGLLQHRGELLIELCPQLFPRPPRQESAPP